MSLVLLIGASLFVRSFLNLQNATVGFDTAPLLTLRFYLPGAATSRRTPRRAACRTSCAASKALPGRAGGVRVELRAARRRRWRRQRRSSKGKTVERGRGAGHHASSGRRRTCARRSTCALAERPRHHRHRKRRRGRRSRSSTRRWRSELWPTDDADRPPLPADRRRIPSGSPSSASSPTSATARDERRRPVLPVGVRALFVRADAQHRPDDPRGRRSGAADDGGSRADSPGRRRAADVPGADDGGSAPAQLLAVQAVRLDVLDVRRRRAAAGVDRRLRRAVVLGVAAHAGDRRARWRSAPAVATCCA